MKYICVASSVLLLTIPAYAKDCANISNPTERLSCYDAGGQSKRAKSANKKEQRLTEAEKSCALESSRKMQRALPDAKVSSTRAAKTGLMVDGQPEYDIEFDIQTSGMNTTVVFGCVISYDGIIATVPKGRKN